MNVHPVSFFLREAFRSSHGKRYVFGGITCGILNGSILPFSIANLMGNLGSPDKLHTAGWLIALLLAISLDRVYTDWAYGKAVIHLKREGIDTLAKRIASAPQSTSSEPTRIITTRFLAAQNTAFWTLFGSVIKLTVGLCSFTVLLVVSGMPWWVYTLVVLVAGMAMSSYWSLKRFVLFRKMKDKESEVGDLLAELRDSRSNLQAGPAIRRALKITNQKAFDMRTKAYRHTLTRYINFRTALNALVCCVAVIAACVTTDTVAATLLVVFMFTFSGHLESIHTLADNLNEIEADGETLLRIANQPTKPVLRPRPNEVCLQTSGVTVQYRDAEGAVEKEVAIPDITLEAGGVYIFTGENGSGKSSLLKAIEGTAEYTGDLRLWGQSVCDFDRSVAVSSFQQTRPSLSVEIGELFKDENGVTDEEARSYALRCVNAEDLNLKHIHRKLSGGQQQKIDLALQIYRNIVKAGEIGLVTLDELSNHLDDTTVALLQERFLKFVAEHIGSDTTMIIVTHDERLREPLLKLPRSQEI